MSSGAVVNDVSGTASIETKLTKSQVTASLSTLLTNVLSFQTANSIVASAANKNKIDDLVADVQAANQPAHISGTSPEKLQQEYDNLFAVYTTLQRTISTSMPFQFGNLTAVEKAIYVAYRILLLFCFGLGLHLALNMAVSRPGLEKLWFVIYGTLFFPLTFLGTIVNAFSENPVRFHGLIPFKPNPSASTDTHGPKVMAGAIGCLGIATAITVYLRKALLPDIIVFKDPAPSTS